MTSVRSNPTTSAQFAELLSGWNRETAYLSVGNFDNRYFNEIEVIEKHYDYINECIDKVFNGEKVDILRITKKL